MADNVAITAGSGTNIAADDVGSVYYQRIKLDGGGDGAAAPILGDSANGLDVDVTRLPSLAAGTNNIGDVDIASIAAGTNNIGDVDIATIPALVAGTASIGGTKDNGPHWTSVYGVSGARYTSADRSASAASVTDAPTGGQKIVVTDIVVSVDTAMRVDFKEETSGTIVMSIYLPANGLAQITPRSKLKLATADKALQVQTSVAGNIAVTAFYFSEA